jgi:hypothetical protein
VRLAAASYVVIGARGGVPACPVEVGAVFAEGARTLVSGVPDAAPDGLRPLACQQGVDIFCAPGVL